VHSEEYVYFKDDYVCHFLSRGSPRPSRVWSQAAWNAIKHGENRLTPQGMLPPEGVGGVQRDAAQTHPRARDETSPPTRY
jgi:hypothetical protein